MNFHTKQCKFTEPGNMTFVVDCVRSIMYLTYLFFSNIKLLTGIRSKNVLITCPTDCSHVSHCLKKIEKKKKKKKKKEKKKKKNEAGLQNLRCRIPVER